MLAPEVKALLEFMNSQPQLPMADVTPALMREGAKAVAGKVEPVYQVVNTLIPIAARDNEPGRNDPLRARIYYPEMLRDMASSR